MDILFGSSTAVAVKSKTSLVGRYDYLDADAVTLDESQRSPRFSEKARKEQPSRASLDRGLVGKQEGYGRLEVPTVWLTCIA